jgi:hypothetical protein
MARDGTGIGRAAHHRLLHRRLVANGKPSKLAFVADGGQAPAKPNEPGAPAARGVSATPRMLASGRGVG